MIGSERPDAAAPASRPLLPAVRRGFFGLCPACGQSRLYQGYLRAPGRCASCDAPLGSHRADDAPPYFTILIVGHIVVPLLLILEQSAHPPTWLHLALWLPLTLILSLALLPRIKGAVIGLQWAQRMHGFGEGRD